MLQKPTKLICEGKSISYPISGHDPLHWFKNNDRNLVVINIDGYIIDKDKKVSALFQKLEYNIEGAYNFNLTDLFTIYSKETITSIIEISNLLNCDYRLFIWEKDFLVKFDPLLLDKKVIFEITLKLNEINEIIIDEIKNISVNDLEQLIFNYRKKDFANVKPLKTGTSGVGCYLSNHTKNPWPGDVDCMIYNPLTKNIGIIIEFKTHNINTLTELEHIGKYGEQDWRRFEVLYNLQKHIKEATNYEPKLIYLAWGTSNSKNHKNIKIDLIKNNEVLKTVIFERPEFNKYCKSLFNKIINI